MPAASTMGRTTTATPEVEPTTSRIDPSHPTTEVAACHLAATMVTAIAEAFVACPTVRRRGPLTG
jgi:hypothetical protein